MEEYILIKYLKAELDSDSCNAVENWLSSSEENRKVLENMYVLMFVNDRMYARNEIDVNRAFDEFKGKNIPTDIVRKSGKLRLWQKAASIAAILILALLCGVLITFAVLDRNSQAVTVSTKLGERAQITLPDGSKVWLNACSSIKYKKSLLSRKRKAELNGEAYFEVLHNTYLPFVVTHHDAEIKVLGTKFNVRCNDDENYLSATLMEGSILFSENKSNVNVRLKPGEELIFDKATREFSLKNLSTPEDILGWMNGRLIFENASLEQIAKSLERHYNVHILFADEKVKQERFNAEFETADNIYQILSILELTKKFTYKINKRDVTISSKQTKNYKTTD